MTEFVESFATQQLLPPWRAKGARMWTFVIRLSEARIREYLAKYFNGAYPDEAPFGYAPLPGAQFGVVNVSCVPDIRTLARGSQVNPVSGGSPWDRLRHTEVYVAFPVLRYAMTKDRLLTGNPTLTWVQPLVYSDNDTVVFSSREIWGTDMFLATVVRQDLPTDQLHLDVGMVGVRRFSPRSVDELLAVLHVRATEHSPLSVPAMLEADPDLKRFVDMLGGSGVFADHHPPPGIQADHPSGVELNNLKQFRDCYDMGAAIYRAIVASQTTYTNVKEVVFYDASKVEIAFMWSDSLAEVLRTILGADQPTHAGPPHEHADDWKGGIDWDMDRVAAKAEFAFSYTADIDFVVLETLYTYGIRA